MVFPLQRIEGKYEILRKLGEGGMGAVYMVRHRLLDEIRVIKVMRPQLESDEENRRRFIREAKVAIKLRHPNIAQIYDFTMDEDGTAFIVLEYIKGLTLDELLKKSGPPALPLALEIAIQSLTALSYLHRRGFVHRDISPDNLMLSQDFDGQPQMKLIDLGIAKVLEGEGNLTATGMFLGKIRYSAPEQFEADVGSSHADARCDLYSFGMVLYELCTGRSPIAGDKPSAIIAGHLFRPPMPFEESDPQGRLPESLRDAILLALEKKADDRVQTAEEFRKRLQAIQDSLDEEEVDLTGTTILPTFPGDGEEGVSLKTPGTTQNVLDLQFGMGTRGTIKTPAGVDRPTRLESPTPSVRSPTGRIATLLAGAEKLAQLEQYQDAKLQLDIVLDIDPDNEEAEKLLATVSKTLDRLTERRRRRALERISAEIETHLATGELVKAEAELHRVQVEFGEDAHLTGLGRRLEMLQDQARKARVAELIEEAEKLRRHGQIEIAIDRLGTAELIDEGNEQVARSLSELEELLARSKELEKLGQSIALLLDAGDLDQAEKKLTDSAAEYGEAEELSPLRQRLVAARREQEQALRRQAAAHFEDGKKALDEDDPAAAIAALDAALALTADDMLALELKRQAEERLLEKERAAERAKAERARIDDLLKQAGEAAEAGRPDEALKLAEGVLKARPEDAEAEKLATSARTEIARLEKEKQEAERQAAEKARLDALVDKARKALENRPEEALRLAEEVLQDQAGDKPATKIAKDARTAIRRAEEQKQKAQEEASEKARVDSILAEARKAARSGDLEKVLSLAEQVLAERSGDEAAVKIVESAKGEIERRRKEKEKADKEVAEKAKRESLLEAAKKEILDHLEAGELEAAGKAIDRASEQTGGSAPFKALANRLGKARKQETRSRIKELLAEGREALEGGRSVAAVLSARQALALDDSHRDAKRFLSRAEGPLGLDGLSPGDRKTIEVIAGRIEDHLVDRNLVAAEQSLYVAKEKHGHAPWVEALGKRLEGLEEESRKAQIESFLKEAKKAIEAQKLPAARETLEKLLLMDPEHKGALSLRSKIDQKDAGRKAEEDREQAVVSAVNSIAALLDGGKPDKALQAAKKAVRDLGDHDALHRVRERAASALLERERLDDTAAPGFGATTVLPMEKMGAPADGATTVLPTTKAQPPADAVETDRLPVQTQPVSPLTSVQETEILARDSQTISQPQQGKAPPPVEKQATPRPEALPPRSPWTKSSRLIPVAAAALALVLLVLWLANREPAVVPVGQAVLIVDALPWAELESIEDSEGQAVEFGDEHGTPLFLDLPSGSYLLRLIGPQGGEPREVKIELEAGATFRHLEEFAKVDTQDYFRELGW